MPDDALTIALTVNMPAITPKAIPMFPIDMNAIKAATKLASEIIRRIPTAFI
jgi:hypothetical protein